MSSRTRKETLREVVSRVLEQAAFVFTDGGHDLSRVDPYAMSFVRVDVGFSGAHTGAVTLIVPISLCGELAVNMLGCEPDECSARESQVDAGKEIANMITGQLLTELFGNRDVINLTAPIATDLAPETFFATLDTNEYVCTMVDDRPVIAILSIAGVAHEHQSTGC